MCNCTFTLLWLLGWVVVTIKLLHPASPSCFEYISRAARAPSGLRSGLQVSPGTHTSAKPQAAPTRRDGGRRSIAGVAFIIPDAQELTIANEPQSKVISVTHSASACSGRPRPAGWDGRCRQNGVCYDQIVTHARLSLRGNSGRSLQLVFARGRTHRRRQGLSTISVFLPPLNVG